MKKIIAASVTVVCLLAVVFTISIPTVNDRTAARLEARLVSLPTPYDSRIVSSISKAGKLTGNGNGMQYFAAILIESELTAEEIEAHYSAYRRDAWDLTVTEQRSARIQQVEHSELFFDAVLSDDKNYFAVYSWGNGIPPFDMLDIRGN